MSDLSHRRARGAEADDRLDHVMFERSLVRHTSGVSLLAAPRTYRDVSFVTPEGAQRVLTLARKAFPYVVADLDHTFLVSGSGELFRTAGVNAARLTKKYRSC